MAPVRIAVCSRDGVQVNERFHRSVDYFVFDLSPPEAGVDEPSGVGSTDLVFVARRARPDPEARVARDFESIGQLLEDCQYILSIGFTGAAKKALSGKGFALHEVRGEIETVIREIVSQSPPAEDGHPGADSPAGEHRGP